MATKSKLFKGFKYISQIFEEGKEEEEEEIQIGFPTDVKHVAHIGGNGPSAEAPSWMKDFKSAPLATSTDTAEETSADVQWVSEDTKTKKKSAASSSKEGSESESSSRGKSSEKKERSRPHRRHHSDSTDVATARNLPDIPKKTRRKKSKEDGTSTRPKVKASATIVNNEAETEHALPPLSGGMY